MFFENHCYTTLDTSLKPTTITYLDHLPEGSKDIIPDDLAQFRDLDNPNEWEEFSGLLEKSVYPPLVIEGRGIRLHDILNKIGPIKDLNLET